MGERIILHCDLNSFYASVELLDKPALWEVPVAVCGDPRTRHGIILAKNEPAKKYGIQTAETVWQAKKKCPGLVLLPPHHDLYKMWSVRVNDIYERFTDLMEYERVKNVYILRNKMLENTRPNLRILHPLPRVNEIAYDVDNNPKAYYFQQAQNGLYAREAILCDVLGITLEDVKNDILL